jgi:hypothetical protein
MIDCDFHQLDPYSPVTARYLPVLYTRINNFLKDINRYPHHEQVAKNLMARLCLSDPNLLVLFATVEYNSAGGIIAHGVFEILDVDGVRICFSGQTSCQVPGIIDKAIVMADNWARSNGCTVMRTESAAELFTEKTAARLTRRYGYKMVSYSFEREINSGQKIHDDDKKSDILRSNLDGVLVPATVSFEPVASVKRRGLKRGPQSIKRSPK